MVIYKNEGKEIVHSLNNFDWVSAKRSEDKYLIYSDEARNTVFIQRRLKGWVINRNGNFITSDGDLDFPAPGEKAYFQTKEEALNHYTDFSRKEREFCVGI